MIPVKILRYHAFDKKTLQGIFEVELDNGLIFRELSHYCKGDNEWINLPSKLIDHPTEPKKMYVPYIKFTDIEKKNKFEKEVLALIKIHLSDNPQLELPTGDLPF
jgi:hypothetical protein